MSNITARYTSVNTENTTGREPTRFFGDTSKSDLHVTVTLFPDKYASSKREWTVTVRQLADLIDDTSEATKSELPWIKLARFGNQPNPKNCLRYDANVEAVTGVEGEHDDGKVSVATAVAALKQAGVLGILYTTPSHTDAKPRWRVLCPLSREHDPTERRGLVERLNGILGGALTNESFTLSQSYYFGSAGGKQAYVKSVQGRPLDQVMNGHASLPKAKKPDDIKHTDAWPEDREGKPFTGSDLTHLHDDPGLGEKRDSHRTNWAIARGAELGNGVLQIFKWMKQSPSFRHYKDDETRVFNDIRRVTSKKLDAGELEVPKAIVGEVLPVWYDDGKVQEILPEYEIRPYILKSEFTMWDGEPFSGKTNAILWLLSLYVKGGTIPGVTQAGDVKVPGGQAVLYISRESDYQRFTLPAMRRLAVEPGKLFLHLKLDKHFQLDETGRANLLATIRHYKVGIFVLDPVNHFKPGELSSYSNDDMYQFILDLMEIAREGQCAGIGVLHDGKDKTRGRGDRFIGATAIRGTARGHIQTAVDADHPSIRRMHHVETQYGPVGPTIVYEIVDERGFGIFSYIATEPATPNDPQGKPDKAERDQTDAAEEWVVGLLKQRGPMRPKDVVEEGSKRSFGKTKIYAAAASAEAAGKLTRDGDGNSKVELRRWKAIMTGTGNE